MPTLLEIQRAFGTALLSERSEEAASHIAAGGIDGAARLNIYRNTSVTTLTNTLRLSYPAIRLLVGDAFFDSASQCFIAEEPARTADLNRYGANFPDFLARFCSAAAYRYLADVARLEWAVNSALRAEEVRGLEAAGFAAIASAPPDRLVLVPHPSLALLHLDWPADVIWRAVLSEDESRLAGIDLYAEPCWLLVERCTHGIEVSRLEEGEWQFTSALCAGASFAKAMTAAADADVDVIALLATHLVAGRFVSFHLA